VLFLLKLGADESEAEDAAQEAMVQAFKAWECIEFPAAWVRKAALHSYLRHVKRTRRQASALEQTARHRGTTQRPEMDLRDEQWRVIALMRQLPRQQRAVAALHYDGLTHEEIAEVLGKPVDTVRSNWRHARTRLKEVIQSEGVGFEDAAR
jgi:RNA polymerase sigma factor (sigma-70 family)